MPKPPEAVGAETRKNFLSLIVPQNSASLKSSEQQRSLSTQQSGESSQTDPILPEHLDKLLAQPWNSDANRQIDLWLWYVQQEFEIAGGTV